jgi:hypothetical protein
MIFGVLKTSRHQVQDGFDRCCIAARVTLKKGWRFCNSHGGVNDSFGGKSACIGCFDVKDVAW